MKKRIEALFVEGKKGRMPSGLLDCVAIFWAGKMGAPK